MMACPIFPSRGSRFVAVGVLGFGVQLIVLGALVKLASVDYRLATLAAVEAAILHNFVWHERWTWRADGRPGRWDRLLRFHAATAIVSIAGNIVVTALLVEWFGSPVVVANVVAVSVLSVANFRAADVWIFAAASTAPARPASARATPVSAAAGRGRLIPVACAVWLATTGAAWADGPTPATLAAWDRYVALTEQRIARELGDGRGPRFLACDFTPGGPRRREALRDGALAAERVAHRAGEGEGDGGNVPDGLIHHWRGALFVRGATMAGLLAAVGDPEAHRALQPDDVLDVRRLSHSPDHLRVFLKLQRRSIVSVAYNTEHDVRYVRHTPGRASSRSVAVKIAEIEDVGLASERERPAGTDRGFLWKMHAYWRYEAVPDGVIVELESLTLSRDLPWGLRTIAGPILSRVARESLERTLTSFGQRVVAMSGEAESDRRR